MFIKESEINSFSANGALTLPAECVGQNDSGWKITAEIQGDYYEWVNYFEAKHPTYGKVWGNFEDKVLQIVKRGLTIFINTTSQNLGTIGIFRGERWSDTFFCGLTVSSVLSL